MGLMDFNNTINQIAFYTDILIFATLLPIELLVYLKLNFKIDRSGLLTLLLHLLVSMIRIVRSQLDQLQSLIVVTGIMIWISLHYFTFEMQLIKIKLTEDDKLKSELKRKQVIRVKTIDTVLMLIFMVLYGI